MNWLDEYEAWLESEGYTFALNEFKARRAEGDKELFAKLDEIQTVLDRINRGELQR